MSDGVYVKADSIKVKRSGLTNDLIRSLNHKQYLELCEYILPQYISHKDTAYTRIFFVLVVPLWDIFILNLY